MTAVPVILSLIVYIPFNSFLPYDGEQAGKGAAAISVGCVTAGNTALDASGNMQIIFSVIDETGTVLWYDSLYRGNSSEILGVSETGSGPVLTGSSSNPSTSEDALALAMDGQMQPVWTFSLDLPLQERFTSAAGSEGITLCAGSTNSIGAGGNDVLMVAVDQNGGELWRKTYGTTGEEAVYHVSLCSDGGYVMACQAMDWGAGNGDYWIIRTDSSGDTLWTGTYGGPEFDYPWRVIQSGDDFFVAGNTLSFGQGSYDWWILKLDADGNVLWERIWGEENTDTCMALAETPWGILVGGASEQGLNNILATAVLLDDSGEVAAEWFFQPGMIRSLSITGDGHCLIGGTVFSPDGNLWAMCVDSNGYAPELGIEPEADHGPMIHLYSNPAREYLRINLAGGSGQVTVRDLTGRTVLETEMENGEASLLIGELPPGVYSVSAGGDTKTASFTVLD
ncbi:MAG TPA: T9SS type A sorting domain-containing protein [Candidatus Sabulitectum sp.]|nr:T9SS type A sorting domain-containing protein [Candidatus Sabulitectum sp.]HPF32054.1 T9SS type A sorting domain-containing protein [Candidatus Sabulitectum sp.]